MRLRHLLGAFVVAICVAAPVVEAFEGWDHTAQDGNDTEANLVVAAVCVGIALTIAAPVLLSRLHTLRFSTTLSLTPKVHARAFVAPIAIPIPAASPPLPLRI